MAGPATSRASSGRWKSVRGWLAGSAAVLLAACIVAPDVAEAQSLLRFPERPRPPARTPDPSRPQDQMLLQAKEIQYDYTNKRVAAVGNVQIYHSGATLEADKVIYDENTKRLHAEGNVRLTEPDGKITYGEIMNLSDNLRDGFVDSLRLDTPDQTRMAATRADRSDGNFTVFHGGVYTACEPCKDDPRKPPLWQVSAARIIHDEGEKMVYFENARLEFFGRPIAFLPVLLGARPDRQAQDRRSDAGRLLLQQVRRGDRGSLLLGAGAGLRLHILAEGHDPPGRAAAGRVSSALYQRQHHAARLRASISSTRARSFATTDAPRRAIATCAARSRPTASSR